MLQISITPKTYLLYLRKLISLIEKSDILTFSLFGSVG